MKVPHFFRWLCLGSLILSVCPPALSASSPIDFNRDIRPILSDNCFACHGPDEKERKGRLRLDLREDALRPGRSRELPIVPGQPDASEVMLRVRAPNPNDIMPPPESGKSLSPDQIALLERWISEGAEYLEHWAFVPPKRPPVPPIPPSQGAISQDAAPNPIDAFLAARRHREDLTPAPEADRPTLIRRATLTLTGLPPTPEEIDAFLADDSPKAYERLVDRLLDSPRFGERMAVDWLDAARYADTHGYHLDSGRDMTAWRDWVIRAFNDNLPFDQFTVEQLAGDLLPNATRSQKIASGFNRNHMINYEGGAIPEEYHYTYLVDRVNTTSTVWLGLTMACAQCHDHKYDPLSEKEFYRFYAFFDNVPERGLDGNRGNAAPLLKLPTPEQEAELARLNHSLDEAQQRLNNALPAIDAAQLDWERQLQSAQPPAAWVTVLPTSLSAAGGASFQALDDQSFRVTGPNPDRDTYSLTFSNPLPALTAVRVEALTDRSLPQRGPGRSANGNFVLTAARLDADGSPLPWKRASASHSQNGYPVDAALDGRSNTGWAVDGAIGRSNSAVLELAAPAAPAAPLTLTLDFQSGFGQHAIGRLRLAVTGSADPHAASDLPDDLRLALAKPTGDRTDDERARIRRHYREQISDDHRRLADAVAASRRARDEFDAKIPTTMIMAERDEPRETFMRLRGEYDKLGEKVTPGTPAALPPLPPDQPPNRLTLARWLVDPKHPLTARVTVNRFWQSVFGTGLVTTPEDFGSQGAWPTHPELLDWLAREFIETGWNMKHLHRLMLTSTAYRQSSRITPELHQRDPDNLLLARGPRFRLQAEFIRDQALAISGLLNPVIGGHSVSPYQPEGLWEELSMREDSKNFSAQFFVQSTGEDLYRRSMYTFWKRSSPPPQMTTFDAPDRETCTVRRPRTNTPLQALILLNDPTYIEASRKLAERLLARPGSDAERVAHAFRLATARLPSPSEQAILLRILDEQRAHYRAHPRAAEDLLSNGEAPRDLTLDSAELAAWTMLSSAILNLDETVTKG
ncbi:MAG: PSD1 domain-containing protein [Verrucomicrobiae bacterium]|nr:PSD1 domain-containing protein [Verrucomicrobiae bacterium]